MFARSIDTKATDNAVEIRRESGGGLVSSGRIKQPNKSFLSDILRFTGIAERAIRQVPDALLMPFDESAERLMIAIRCFRHELSITRIGLAGVINPGGV